MYNSRDILMYLKTPYQNFLIHGESFSFSPFTSVCILYLIFNAIKTGDEMGYQLQVLITLESLGKEHC